MSGRRCRLCGRATESRCAEHPRAELISWSRELGYAYRYIAEYGEGRTDEEVLRFASDFDPRYYPGATVGAMALCYLYWRDWGRDYLPEARTPKRAPTPAGLFG